MQLNAEQVKIIGKIIQKANRILIIPHKNPDGDTLGSALALYKVFKNLGKTARIACADEAPPAFSFMPNREVIQKGLEENPQADAIFILDAGATHLTGFNVTHPRLFDKSLETVNIDHHPSNDFYGKYNLVESRSASATMIIYQLLTDLEIPIDRETATCLLTGIYTDTGSLQHSNTSAEVLRVAGKLLAKGADLRSISKELFNTTPLSTMHLWGRVMRNTYQTADKVTLSVVTENDFKSVNADYSEISGAVDYVNSIPGAMYSVILTERDGKVKGSLRTLRDEVDVAKIASEYGGGGHTKAAGFTVSGRLEKEVRWKVVD